MTSQPFNLRQEMLDPQTAVITLHGSLTFAAESELMDAYNASLQDGARRVVLDFSHLDFMNSTGIGLLVTLLVRANRYETRLLATGLNPHYKEIFHLTKLEEAFMVVPNLEALPAV